MEDQLGICSLLPFQLNLCTIIHNILLYLVYKLYYCTVEIFCRVIVCTINARLRKTKISCIL